MSDNLRSELGKELGFGEEWGEEIDRTPAGENLEWVRMKTRDPLGLPSWFAILRPIEDND